MQFFQLNDTNLPMFKQNPFEIQKSQQIPKPKQQQFNLLIKNRMSLPLISQQTQQVLKRQGFINRLYTDLKLHECYKPRTLAHDLYTYGIMAVAGLGYLVARRGGYSAMSCGAAFVSAPIFALFQKRQLDFYQNTNTSIIHPKQLAEQFPILFQQYNNVLGQVEDEISKQKEVLRTLENQYHN